MLDAVAGLPVLGIVVAAVAGFAFGAVYYTTLGGVWLSARGMTREDIEGAQSVRPFIIAAVAQTVIATVLAVLLGALHGTGFPGPVEAVTWTAIIWVGIVVTTMSVNHAFQDARPLLTVVDCGHWFGVLVLQAQVLSLLA